MLNRMCGGFLVVVLAVFAGCTGKQDMAYRGPEYPPTARVTTVFHPDQVQASCKVFAHLLVYLPAGLNGEQVRRTIETEARSRGADTLFINQSRQADKDEGLRFHYYGPEREYFFAKQWNGWKFGYEAWCEQGEWVNIGFKEWGNSQVLFDYPVVVQAAFLRCQK